ncbi:ATP-grasp domain-containing protein [Burkholderia territorii]|uniref:ATP-grasp domain-containing protein n=1 Tax=Burkholderia territorii TaxID=1503055 RepID=UPI0012D88B56|nr:hypothetical protein [Burkholderia territorii]
MKLAIITYVAKESSNELAEALRQEGIGVDVLDMGAVHFDEGRAWHYDCVLSYGCSDRVQHRNRLNQADAVKRCIDKVETFKALRKAGVPIPMWKTERNKVPKNWDSVVVRESRVGRKAEGFHHWLKEEGELPHGELYTKYYEHRNEYRVVVFMGKYFVYYKRPVSKDGEEWHEMVLQPARKFEAMGRHALAAAKALGIDYAGFDVVANSRTEYVFLEANSGPILNEEVKDYIVKWFKEKK